MLGLNWSWIAQYIADPLKVVQNHAPYVALVGLPAYLILIYSFFFNLFSIHLISTLTKKINKNKMKNNKSKQETMKN